jgi:hypothetical protein
MSVTLFTLFVDDPEPVFEWLALHGGEHVVRKQAVETASGWSMKVALNDPDLSNRFSVRWGDVLATLENQRKWVIQRRG